MVSPVFFFLFATTFAAVIPHVKRDSFSTLSSQLSLVDDSLTGALTGLSGLDPTDPESVDTFMNDFTNVVDTANKVIPVIQNTIKSQPPPSLAQFKKLGVQLDGMGASIKSFVQGVLGKNSDIADSDLTCFVHQTSTDMATAMTILASGFVAGSPKSAAAAQALDALIIEVAKLQTAGDSNADCTN